MGPTATIIENIKILGWFYDPHRYWHDSGWELCKFSSGYMYQKIRKTNSVHSSVFWIIYYKLLADFFLWNLALS
jgi:hypothetical protein